ncbi:beta-ketoacyl-ACP synthase 3 [Streptomyces sp. NPDC051320]|uniref:beta-ketoacyl-ACP synthase 3 n=1 Tax=Streptomyces sp. NPDC051320 TaxID=3154644 RepID=UPI00343B8EF1
MGRPTARTAPASVITGIGACLPPRAVSNDEISEGLDTSDTWIRERIGIRERRHVESPTSTGDLAVQAGRLALKADGYDRVDAVVMTSTTPDWNCCPATGPAVASRLGLTGVGSFDVTAACSGFLYSLSLASGLIATRTARRVLVIGAETLSTIRDPLDRDTAAILGDGAGAVVLRAGEPDEPGAIGRCVLGSDGELAELLQVPAGGSRQRSAGTVPERADQYLQMRGKETYRHAVQHMRQASLDALRLAGWDVSDVDRLAAHQANARICDSVADKLGIGPERRLANIDRVGNTGAASIPLLLAESAVSGDLLPGQRALLVAFGSGLTWAATTLVWPEVTALTETAAHRD